LFKSSLAAAGLLLTAFLLWALRGLIVPVVVSGLLAYISRPLVAALERYRIPRGGAVAMLLVAFVLAIASVVSVARALVPTEVAAIELKVRLLYALNERYRELMGLDPSLTRGNRLYRWSHADLDPLLNRATELLSLSAEERAKLLASRASSAASAESDPILRQDRANVQRLDKLARTFYARADPEKSPDAAHARMPLLTHETHIATLGEVLSTWLIAPLIFFFLIRDTGEIKRGLLSVVPNRLFEPALTLMDDLDNALGDWARGLFLECCLLGLTLMVLLAAVGIPWRWAMAIGFVGGLSNLVPYFGFVVALTAGLAYALVTEGLHPLLPVMGDARSVAIWVIVAVALAELVKNAIYEPMVLGNAVKLHPLVVVIVVASAAVLFGFAGVLLAIPSIVALKVFVASTARQLKAYRIM
jgi:predicted PurR-regulated permease PerM